MDVMKGMLFGSGPSIVEARSDLNIKRIPKNLTIQTTSLNRRISCILTSRVIGKHLWTFSHGCENIPFPLLGFPEFKLTCCLVENFNPGMYEKIATTHMMFC